MDAQELNPEAWDRFGWRLLRLWLKAYIIVGRLAMPLLKYTLAFAIQMKKNTENLIQVTGYHLCIGIKMQFLSQIIHAFYCYEV
jgi:hypothetical protein